MQNKLHIHLHCDRAYYWSQKWQQVPHWTCLQMQNNSGTTRLRIQGCLHQLASYGVTACMLAQLHPDNLDIVSCYVFGFVFQDWFNPVVFSELRSLHNEFKAHLYQQLNKPPQQAQRVENARSRGVSFISKILGATPQCSPLNTEFPR